MTATVPAPQLLALVDVEDLEDGGLAAGIPEIEVPAGVVRRAVPLSPAARQAQVDAVVAAWRVSQGLAAAVQAHGFGARAAALVA